MIDGAEVAKILGVSRQRVHQMIEEYDDFPKPILVFGTLRKVRVWNKSEIVQWHEKR